MIDKVIRLTEIFSKNNIEYLFIGKSGAILYGYPGTTQDIDIFPQKTQDNSEKLVKAMEELGFVMDKTLKESIIKCKDFIQIRGGPFPIDIVFAPDGIESYDDAKRHSMLIDNKFPCASIDDIIKSKKAAKRQRDKEELPRLESFRNELRQKKQKRGGSASQYN